MDLDLKYLDKDLKYMVSTVKCPCCKLTGWWSKIDPNYDPPGQLLYRCQDCKNIMTLTVSVEFERLSNGR
jgi:hypothetical protein